MQTPAEARAAPAGSAEKKSERFICLLLGAILIMSAGTQLATAEFGPGVVSHLARFGEIYADSWDDWGFGRTLGVPLSLNTGSTVVERVPYAHMPPLGWWPPYLGRSLFGKGPLGLRLFPTIFTMGGLAILSILIARRSRPFFGLAFLTASLAMPGVQLYAAMPGIESISLFMIAVFLWMLERKSYRVSVGVAFLFLLGCQTAWPFYFIAPGLVIASFGRSGWKRLWPLFPIGVLGFLLVVLHLILGVGDAEFVWNDLKETVRNTTQDGLSGDTATHGTRGAFLASVIPMLRLNLGLPTAVLSVVLLVAALLRPRCRGDAGLRLSIAVLVVGILNVVLFNGRSSSHSYYYFLLAVAVAMVIVTASHALLLSFPKPGLANRFAGVLLLTTVACSSHGLASNWDFKQQLEAEGAAAMAELIDTQVPADRAFVCFRDEILDAVLYSKRRFLPPLPSIPLLDGILSRMDRGEEPFTGLVVLLDEQSEAAFPEYAAKLRMEAKRRAEARIIASGLGTVFML
ncbi:MAG TPA: hypothetical protein PKA37_03280 [Planctomycetota bacterium]|jgi:hypothetical protein|nr:hypothetical protein [Planctomycetota bacterium]